MSGVGPRRVASEGAVERAVRWRREGYAIGVIAADLGVSRRTVYRYLGGETGRFERRVRRMIDAYPGSIDDRAALAEHIIRTLAHRP